MLLESIKAPVNGRKIICKPPLFHDNKFITDDEEKGKIFNFFFEKKCSLMGVYYRHSFL